MFTGFLWLALSIGSEITGTSMIKKTNSFSKLAPSILVVIAYCLCYFALTRAMDYIPVGVAYSLWCGFGIVGVTILSMILYKQKPDIPAVFAMALIITGGIIMNAFSTL
ncbi:DMT family transporter [Moellerella wisconsensis]|uniref:Ethidium bromide/methyl viologen resistance protein n=1 Tax=Moellerella wisconsensis ATCC 35017 TaxID=1354267 RepID=A0A0N0ZA83_9GAMM|nr:multidrug efflux SMR transporter [Moellerella wisconsensis]KPD04164.1 ethidium bromide/methyl viologen resistance protein [Moellerella wisconsensis ATCC 35017]VFS52349.1 Methyl viologen resistance protein C [Moellerella wisconsensis]